MATITNNGLNLLASMLINPGANTAVISYVAVGSGAATLSGGLTAGVLTSALPVNALAANIAAGQALTIIGASASDTVTVTSAGALAGATSIPINPWTPTFSFPAGSGLVNTPTATDTQLQAESTRVVTSAAATGASAGETLVSGYFDPSVATGTYLEVGFFGGATASLTANSGTLVCRDVVFWSHTLNADSLTTQLDSIV